MTRTFITAEAAQEAAFLSLYRAADPDRKVAIMAMLIRVGRGMSSREAAIQFGLDTGRTLAEATAHADWVEAEVAAGRIA